MKNAQQVLTQFFAASNARDMEAYIAFFAEDAEVSDERQTYKGHEQIRAWYDDALEKYNCRHKLLSVQNEEGLVHAKAGVSGNFDGSPLVLDYKFRFENNQIKSLKIY